MFPQKPANLGLQSKYLIRLYAWAKRYANRNSAPIATAPPTNLKIAKLLLLGHVFFGAACVNHPHQHLDSVVWYRV
jgi:hypothetical protein